MKCKISSWGCIYHACMSDDCQKAIVIENMPEIEKEWGKGRCKEKTETSNNQINKQTMALSFENVKKAYTVLNEIKKTVLPELSIGSFPEDMSEWTESEKENPRLNEVLGYDKKSDSGWENLVFFVKSPSEELKQKFEELATKVDNSSISKSYTKNKSLWIFGWF